MPLMQLHSTTCWSFFLVSFCWHCISTRPWASPRRQHWRPSVCWLQYRSTHLRSKLIFSMWSLRSKDHNSEFVGKVEASVLGSWGITPGKVVAFPFSSKTMDCWSLGHCDAMSTLPFARGEKWTRIWKDGWRTLGVTHMSKVFEFGKWEGQHGINYDNPWHNNKSYFEPVLLAIAMSKLSKLTRHNS